MKHFREDALVFFIGSCSYSAIEILWRKYTHWSMFLTGGLCFALLHRLFHRYRRLCLWKKCVLGAFSITGVEFSVGCVVNRWLKLNVWDYKNQPGNILGQVCPLYTFLWALLCVPACGLSRTLHRTIMRLR